MAIQYSEFEKTPLGQALFALVNQEDRLIELKAFSREGFPAVTALVTEVAEVLQQHGVTETKDRNYAKQSVGDFVARVMRDAGYEKVGQRSVPGKTFTSGAMWKPRGET